jgi:hypothetical protein
MYLLSDDENDDDNDDDDDDDDDNDSLSCVFICGQYYQAKAGRNWYGLSFFYRHHCTESTPAWRSLVRKD